MSPQPRTSPTPVQPSHTSCCGSQTSTLLLLLLSLWVWSLSEWIALCVFAWQLCQFCFSSIHVLHSISFKVASCLTVFVWSSFFSGLAAATDGSCQDFKRWNRSNTTALQGRRTNLQTSVKLNQSKLNTLCWFRYNKLNVCRTCWRTHSQSRITILLFIYFFHLKLGDVCLSRDAQTEKWAQPMQLVNISFREAASGAEEHQCQYRMLYITRWNPDRQSVNSVRLFLFPWPLWPRHSVVFWPKRRRPPWKTFSSLATSTPWGCCIWELGVFSLWFNTFMLPINSFFVWVPRT